MEKYQESKYLVLDGRQNPVARAILESREDASQLQIRVLDGGVDEVSGQDHVQLVGMSKGTNNVFARVIRSRGDRVLLESQGPLGADVRENLRIPVRFTSYIYPLSGDWRGRRTFLCRDLSCSGIAFESMAVLAKGERFEAIVPVTTRPLILKTEILRATPNGNEPIIYAAKFVDMIDDEETLLREAVFSIQLRSMGKRYKRKTTGKGMGFS